MNFKLHRRNENVNKHISRLMHRVTLSNKVFKDTDDLLLLPAEIEFVSVTLVGAGGAGAKGYVKGKMVYTGGGGGAGNALVRKPVVLENPDNEDVLVKVDVGAGGTLARPDGGDTAVTVYVGERMVAKLVALGGKGARDNLGGKCVENKQCNIIDGQDGQDGTIAVMKKGKVFGGNGGNSYFHEGGVGAYNRSNHVYVYDANQDGIIDDYDAALINDNSNSTVGLDGRYGSGGGGNVPYTTTTRTGNGGSGFVIVEY